MPPDHPGKQEPPPYEGQSTCENQEPTPVSLPSRGLGRWPEERSNCPGGWGAGDLFPAISLSVPG